MFSLRNDNSISVGSVVPGTNARLKDPYRIDNIKMRDPYTSIYCTN